MVCQDCRAAQLHDLMAARLQEEQALPVTCHMAADHVVAVDDCSSPGLQHGQQAVSLRPPGLR